MPTSTRSSSATWRCPRRTCSATLNHGWAVSQGSLRHERGMLWIMNVAKMERTLRGLVRVARRPDGRGGTLGDDPRLAEAIGRLATDTVAMRCLGLPRASPRRRRGEMSPEHMVLKLFTSEAEQRAMPAGAGGAGPGGPRPRRPGPQPLHRVGPRPLRRRTGSRRAPTAPSTTAPGPCSTCARSPAPSPGAPRRSSATSWPSACSACPGGDAGADRRCAVLVLRCSSTAGERVDRRALEGLIAVG